MKSFNKILACLLINLLLWFIQTEINNLFSAYGVWFFWGSLYFLFAGCYFDFETGIIITFLTAIILSAGNSFLFKVLPPLFILGHIMTFLLRNRIQREHNLHLVLFALITNCMLFFIMSLASLGSGGSFGRYFFSAVLSAAISSAIIFLIGGWFFTLQKSFFNAMGREWKNDPEKGSA